MRRRRLRALVEILQSRLMRAGVEIDSENARPIVLRFFADMAIKIAEIKARRSPDEGERDSR